MCVCLLTSLALLVKEMLDKELKIARYWSISKETEMDGGWN